jgi:hypothetical protein
LAITLYFQLLHQTVVVAVPMLKGQTPVLVALAQGQQEVHALQLAVLERLGKETMVAIVALVAQITGRLAAGVLGQLVQTEQQEAVETVDTEPHHQSAAHR